ncbi:SurA N-terminal domain-containing protein [Streptomyces sp. TS71-3]|uniref:SurA N-terminal domain-containing protein n=1 Tax=Streptomyces sp. TS71-3 TaxID=2733862 RepID=UPI001B0957CE|nr:SurA N-terminal domain-containing protein [Streptomyces sp. TS71-3]GHJ39622.1 lipoprotein [Streptomyces sp. TS71-3]
MHRRRRTALLVSSAALLAAAPLLTGCGNDAHPGAAAVVDGRRITVSELEGRVNEVRGALRSALKDDTQYEQVVGKTGGLTRSTLQTMVLDRVLHRAAQDAGVAASRKEVQMMRTGMESQAGGAKALETGWLEQYAVAPAHLDESLRTELEAQKLAKKLGINMNSPDGQAALWKHLGTTSKSMNIDINPRYGAWDVKKSSRVDAKVPWLREVSSPPQQQV